MNDIITRTETSKFQCPFPNPRIQCVGEFPAAQTRCWFHNKRTSWRFSTIQQMENKWKILLLRSQWLSENLSSYLKISQQTTSGLNLRSKNLWRSFTLLTFLQQNFHVLLVFFLSSFVCTKLTSVAFFRRFFCLFSNSVCSFH